MGRRERDGLVRSALTSQTVSKKPGCRDGVMGLGLLDGLPANAAAFAPESPLALGNTMQMCGLGTGGIIRHTIRFANGTWQRSFGDVNAQESNPNMRFIDLGMAGILG